MVNRLFYSHVNYSVTKIDGGVPKFFPLFYSHVNYSVTKIRKLLEAMVVGFTVT